MELFVQQPQKESYPVPKTLTPEFKLLFENYCVPLRYNYRCEDDVKTFFLNSAVAILSEGIVDVPKKKTAQKCFRIYYCRLAGFGLPWCSCGEKSRPKP